SAEWPALERALEERLRELAGFGQLIDRANQPAPLESASEAALRALAARRYRGIDGQEQPYLSADELNALAIPRGSLTAAERSEIESHVVHTYNFLQKIPWGRQFRNLPAIAGGHHEKLDGSGYPGRVQAADIPVETRMLTIADIFDALTASDRPYKKAIPTA